MAKIEQLTPEQEKDLEATYQYWLKVGRSCERINQRAVEQVITKMYEKIGHKKPKFYFLRSPKECIQMYTKLTGDTNLSNQMNNYFAGNQWCSWEAFYDFCRRIGVEYTDEQNELLDLWLEQSRQCHWWFPYDEVVLVSDRPVTLTVDDRGRLHNTTGPALAYADGWSLYMVHGVQVPEDIILDHKTITVERIEKEQNAEVRRVMIELYGQAQYILDSGAKLIHQDDWGALYQKEIPNDEPIVMVKVVNSTPEPDGSMKDYWLRVNPELRPLLEDGTMGEPQKMTARNAVASTFGRKGSDYDPDCET